MAIGDPVRVEVWLQANGLFRHVGWCEGGKHRFMGREWPPVFRIKPVHRRGWFSSFLTPESYQPGLFKRERVRVAAMVEAYQLPKFTLIPEALSR